MSVEYVYFFFVLVVMIRKQTHLDGLFEAFLFLANDIWSTLMSSRSGRGINRPGGSRAREASCIDLAQGKERREI
jgi:hypothetical protein